MTKTWTERQAEHYRRNLSEVVRKVHRLADDIERHGTATANHVDAPAYGWAAHNVVSDITNALANVNLAGLVLAAPPGSIPTTGTGEPVRRVLRFVHLPDVASGGRPADSEAELPAERRTGRISPWLEPHKETDMKEVTIYSTWRSSVTVEVPDDFEMPSTLDGFGDDVHGFPILDQMDTSTAELVDWGDTY